MAITMLNYIKKKTHREHKKSPSTVFEEYLGYLGKGNTDIRMRELRGDSKIDNEGTLF